MPGAHPLTIAGSAGITLTGPVKVDGKLDCTATITAATDVVGGGKSLKDYVHKVQAGAAIFGTTAMIGMGAGTGKPLGGEGHPRQSVRVIFSTPLDSHIAGREHARCCPNLLTNR